MVAALHYLFVFSLLAISTACVQLLPASSGGNACLRQFQHWDARIDAAGRRDAGEHRPAGFPWLRSNRFWASFSQSVTTSSQWSAWLEGLRQLDLQARRGELRNLGTAEPVRELAWLDSCGRQLNQQLLADTAAREQLRERVDVPDDYSLMQRLLGLYPIALPFLKQGISRYQAEALEAAEQARSKERAGGRLWQLSGQAALAVDVGSVGRDALGIPRLSAADWRGLAALHAPSFWIASPENYDLPGRPVFSSHGAGVATQTPLLYFYQGFTRYQGQVLPQLVYTIWFDQRPTSSPFDPYAGRLDGLLWRVTLDANGAPLFYDSIHSCGCYHWVYPASAASAAVVPSGKPDWDEERPLFAQGQLPSGRLVLQIESGTHYLQQVLTLKTVQGVEVTHYDLRDYDELLSLAVDDGGRRSLFDSNGLVAGTERAERWWLWPSGVISPGAMRQRGRHALAFVGRRHFDAPYLWQQLAINQEANSQPRAGLH